MLKWLANNWLNIIAVIAATIAAVFGIRNFILGRQQAAIIHPIDALRHE